MSTDDPPGDEAPNQHGPGRKLEVIRMKSQNDKIQQTWYLEDIRSRRGEYGNLELAVEAEDLVDPAAELCAGIRVTIKDFELFLSRKSNVS